MANQVPQLSLQTTLLSIEALDVSRVAFRSSNQNPTASCQPNWRSIGQTLSLWFREVSFTRLATFAGICGSFGFRLMSRRPHFPYITLVVPVATVKLVDPNFLRPCSLLSLAGDIVSSFTTFRGLSF
jgi:hypothetical protein